jgi:hypothetical protein
VWLKWQSYGNKAHVALPRHLEPGIRHCVHSYAGSLNVEQSGSPIAAVSWSWYTPANCFVAMTMRLVGISLSEFNRAGKSAFAASVAWLLSIEISAVTVYDVRIIPSRRSANDHDLEVLVQATMESRHSAEEAVKDVASDMVQDGFSTKVAAMMTSAGVAFASIQTALISAPSIYTTDGAQGSLNGTLHIPIQSLPPAGNSSVRESSSKAPVSPASGPTLLTWVGIGCGGVALMVVFVVLVRYCFASAGCARVMPEDLATSAFRKTDRAAVRAKYAMEQPHPIRSSQLSGVVPTSSRQNQNMRGQGGPSTRGQRAAAGAGGRERVRV